MTKEDYETIKIKDYDRIIEMKVKDLWVKEQNFLRWNYQVNNRPEIKNLPDRGFLGLVKKVMLEDLNKNAKKTNIPWAPDFSYSTYIKGYIIDLENERAVWIISNPRPEGYSPLGSSSIMTSLFPQRYLLKIFKKGMLPKVFYKSDDPISGLSINPDKKEVSFSENIGSGTYMGWDVRIPNGY